MTRLPVWPSIPLSYAQLDEGEWVDRADGTTICWSAEQGVFQCYRPVPGEWSWWDTGSSTGSPGWRPYRFGTHRVRLRADFWVYSVIGLVIFVWAVAHGVALGGFLVFLVLCLTGLGVSWLRSRHPAAYDAVAAAGLVGAAVGIYHGVHRQ